jgi:hypothetical protein
MSLEHLKDLDERNNSLPKEHWFQMPLSSRVGRMDRYHTVGDLLQNGQHLIAFAGGATLASLGGGICERPRPRRNAGLPTDSVNEEYWEGLRAGSWDRGREAPCLS